MVQADYSKLAIKALNHAQKRNIRIGEVILLKRVNTQLKRKDFTNEKRQALIETGVRYANIILTKSVAV